MSKEAEKLKRAIAAYRDAHNTPAALSAYDRLRAVVATLPRAAGGGR